MKKKKYEKEKVYEVTMVKDLSFWRECLRLELKKPLNKMDFMYMRYIDEEIYKLKLNKN
jgi:hypothetical protein